MKKSLLTICTILGIFSFIFVISNINVNAANNAPYLNDNSLIYNIDEFNIDLSDNNIYIKGWAFIHDLNNFGGDNTTIEVIAVGGNGEEIEADITYDNTRNRAIYYANCQTVSGRGCGEEYENYTCNPKSNSSSCRYDNIGFTASIDMDELKEVGNGTTFNFKIRVNTDWTYKSTGERRNITDEAKIVVSTEAISNKENDEPQTIYKNDDIQIKISYLAETAIMRASYAHILANNMGERVYPFPSTFYWEQHKKFVISDSSICQNKDKEQYGLVMYELNYSTSTDCKWGEKCAGPGTGLKGWAYSTWVEVTGDSVMITVGDPNEDLDNIDNNKNCPTEKSGTNNLELDCEEEGYFDEVVVENIRIQEIINSSDSDYTKYKTLTAAENGSCSKDLIKVITGSACITQSGTAKFNLDRAPIYSGGGFSFFSEYNGQAKYEFCSTSDDKDSDNNDKYYKIGARKESYEDNDDDAENLEITIIEKEEETHYRCSSVDGYKKSNNHNGTCTYTSRTDGTSYTTSADEYTTCEDVVTDYSIEKYSEEWHQVTKYMQGLLEHPVDNAVTKSVDSNEITYHLLGKTTNLVEIGYWESDFDSDTDSKEDEIDDDNYKSKRHWEPGEIVEYNLSFDLGKACINSRTAEVKYVKNGQSCSSLETDKEIYTNGGNLYYVPLKYPSIPVPIQVSVDDVNVLADEDWSISYECDVECQQKLFKDLNDPGASLDFKFIYRPITFANPFPTGKMDNSWTLFMEDDNARNNKMNRNNLEYSIILSPNDIISIKNNNRDKQRNYANLDNINKNGSSSYLNDLISKNIVVRYNNTYYNKLGKCTKECWNESALDFK